MNRGHRVTFQLPPELHSYVQAQLRSGRFSSKDELVHQALYLLREQDEFIDFQSRQLKREIAIGLAQAKRGLVGPFSAAEIKREGRRRLRSRRRAG